MPKSTQSLVIQGLGSLGLFALGLVYTVSEVRQDSPDGVAMLASVVVLAAGVVGAVATIVEWRRSANDERRK